ncbi:PREDICTED: uncharacterized protein LOC109233775 [Nicotiana attenuata]|uniref:uncharacterized protein LOC109233775 n=1 Tax=Nicotiana attenuata TaxID=49451 RepID=UPI0009057693|nr:PREDICTED: uncharacterized protein LOC109233775 [Nicotiana attenuata]
MEILREKQGFIIGQRKFTLELLQEFNCPGGKISSPLDPSIKLQADSGIPMDDPSLYRHLVGKLNYLTNTRPDISFVVLSLSQYMHRPCSSHFSAAQRVLRYLRTDPSQGILPSSSPSFDLLAFCDADWAACRDSRRSASVSLSSAEAKYRLMRRVTVEITWLVRLLGDLTVQPTLPVLIHSDSQAAIHIARNPIFHERTKHVDLDCHFVRQQFLFGLISLSFVPSDCQLADLFTKPLSQGSHRHILSKLGVHSLPSILRGDVDDQNPHIDSKENEETRKKKMKD